MNHEGEPVRSFVSAHVLELARAIANQIEDGHGELRVVDVGLQESNPMYISDDAALLKTVFAEIHDDDGRPFYLGFTKE